MSLRPAFLGELHSCIPRLRFTSRLSIVNRVTGTVNHRLARAGEFYSGIMGNFQPELIFLPLCRSDSCRIAAIPRMANVQNTGMAYQQNDAHNPPDQTLEFLSVSLRLSGLVELLVSYRDNSFVQLTKCAYWYKERALRELFPVRKNLGSLDKTMRRSVAQRAIEMAIDDSHQQSGASRIPERVQERQPNN